MIGGKILATAIFSEGRFVQAFPAFGVERRGAPLQAYVRVDDTRIDLRSQIYHPDHLIILDSTLLGDPTTFSGFRPGGWVLINCRLEPSELKKSAKFSEMNIATVDASGIAARNELGSALSPIVNTAILGAFCRITGICSIDSICKSITKGMTTKPEINAKAAREAFEEVKT